MEDLKTVESLSIREKKEYTGLLSGWTFKPEFCLAGSADEELYYVVSDKGKKLGYDFLKNQNTFTLYMINRKGEEILYFEKHFGILSHKMDIYDPEENLIGVVQKSAQVGKTGFTVHDGKNKLLYTVEGPAALPEVLHIFQNGTTVGKISKRWGKTAEEGVAKQLHFGIVFPMGSFPEEKAALLGALFLLDFFY